MTAKLLCTASAPVDAPIADVRRLIDDGWVADVMLGDGEARNYVDVDHRPGVVGIAGHWWYRGEISASTAGDHTVITCSVYNIAERAAWAVPLANQFFIGYRRTVRDRAAGLARTVEDHLGRLDSAG